MELRDDTGTFSIAAVSDDGDEYYEEYYYNDDDGIIAVFLCECDLHIYISSDLAVHLGRVCYRITFFHLILNLCSTGWSSTHPLKGCN